MQPPLPRWGTILLDARIHMRSTPLEIIWLELTIVACMMAINMVGDVLRDAFAEQDTQHN
ncbi:hypothetical protein KIN_32760 [Litoreibacter roseus]|uniref:Uncharacterized protein n=1 Tax=Litoreibacter roseus TaxID=2601869 RepID=A0A6N6JLY1_9RHOB|nr:hypothetical protein KIN_32760 [Litoreibacter roseus]